MFDKNLNEMWSHGHQSLLDTQPQIFIDHILLRLVFNKTIIEIMILNLIISVKNKIDYNEHQNLSKIHQM